MTDRTTRANRIPAGLADAVRWVNAAGETVPAYGVIQLRTNFTASYSQASKPDAGEGLFFANGPVQVADTKYGESYLWNHPRLVLISDTPTVGDEVGPEADSWEMSTAGVGFRVLHQVVNGVGAVVPVGGGSSAYSLTFSIVSHDPDTRTAIVHIESAWPAGPVPGSYLEDSVVNVCDMAGCYLNNPDTGALIGIWGHANYEIPRVPTVCDPNEYPPYAARWIIDAMCCPSTCVE